LKGSVLFGGKINYTNNNSDLDQRTDIHTSQKTKSNAFSFDPQIGYTLKNNWVVGTTLSFQGSKRIVNSTSSNSSNTSNERLTDKANAFGAALFARKYFPLGDKFSAFGEFSSGALWNNITSTYVYANDNPGENNAEYVEYQTRLLAGLAYFPKNWMAIELSTNLVTFTSSDQETVISQTNTNSFDFGFNTSSINLGVSFFLNNK